MEELFQDFPKPHFERHEVLSTLLSSILLKEDKGKWHDKIITAILFHHFNRYFYELSEYPEIIFDNSEKLCEYLQFLKHRLDDFKEYFNNMLNELSEKFSDSEFIKEALYDLYNLEWNNIEVAHYQIAHIYEDDLSAFTEYYKPPNIIGKEVKDYSQEFFEFLVLLGALHRVDYSASGKVNVESENFGIFDFDNLARLIEEKIKGQVADKDSFNFWQKKIIEGLDNSRKLILIAPTGSGKTEFSILWGTKNPRKFVYTLPLRVALNDLFTRFKGSEDAQGYFEPQYVNILHSTSFIEYLKGNISDINVESKLTAARLLSDPVLLTTPDQIFLTSLNYYGSDKVLSVYPYSNLVIDEIQTLSPEMAAVIIRTLQIINSLGGNILIMTATFPPYFGKFFDALGFEKIDVSKSGIEVKNLRKPRHKIRVIEDNLFDYNRGADLTEEGLEAVRDFLRDKDNALLVVNNVKKAINLYKKLIDQKEFKELNGFNIYLLHSRIVEKYKSERIEKVKK